MLIPVRRIAIIIAVTLLAAGNAIGQNVNFQPVELTEDSASRALSAMPDVYQTAQRYEGVVAQNGDDGMGGLTGLAAYAAARADLDQATSQYGFAGYEDWLSTIQTIFHTHAYTRSAGALQQAEPALKAAMQKVLANPNLSQAQKDAIMAQMAAAIGSAGLQAPSAGNQAVVTALGPLIEQTMQFLRSVR